MASGVAVSDDVVTAFNDLKMGKKSGCCFICLKIENEKEIVIEKEACAGECYEDLVSHLKACRDGGECRYALVDVEVDAKSGAKTNKLGLIAWCADDAKIKQRMLYTSSAEALKNKLRGGYKFVQANDDDELSMKHIKDKLTQL